MSFKKKGQKLVTEMQATKTQTEREGRRLCLKGSVCVGEGGIYDNHSRENDRNIRGSIIQERVLFKLSLKLVFTQFSLVCCEVIIEMHLTH